MHPLAGGFLPKSGMYRYWQEVGIAKDRQFVDLDEYGRYECADGRTLVLYNNVDRLEKHLLEFSPQDADVIKEFIVASACAWASTSHPNTTRRLNAWRRASDSAGSW